MLTPAGVELIGQWDSHCFDEQVGVQGPLVAADPATVEPFASLLAANTAGTTATPAPLLIFHGDADERIPLAQSDALLARLCAAGQVVERRVLPGGIHVAGSAAVQSDGVALAHRPRRGHDDADLQLRPLTRSECFPSTECDVLTCLTCDTRIGVG